MTRSNSDAWYVWVGDYRLSRHWSAAAETQFQRWGLIDRQQQLFLRSGIARDLGASASLMAGYAFEHTTPYGVYPAAAPFDEHRAYEQLTLAQRTGMVAWTHRYRTEQRWIERLAADSSGVSRAVGWRYANRVRYQLRATVPLAGRTLEAREPYLTAYDELFVSWGHTVRYNVLDQNRALAAVGYRVTPGLRVEIGYLNQRVIRANGEQVENNHTLQVGVFTSGGR